MRSLVKDVVPDIQALTNIPDERMPTYRAPFADILPRNLARLVAVAMIGTALAVGAALLWLTYQDVYAGFVWDDAYYLLMADRYSPYAADPSPVLTEIIGTRNFPPLYPLLLAVAGAGSAAIGRAHLVTTGCALIALTLFYFWLGTLGVRPVARWVATLALALAPITLMHLPVLWSEHLYLALTMGVLLAVSRADTRPGGRNLAALLVALAALTRVAGVSLVGAFAVYALWRWRRRGILPALLATLPVFAERTINTLVSHSGSNYHSHGWAFITSQDILHLAMRQLASLYAAWERVMALEPGPLAAWTAVLLMAPLTLGILSRLRHGQLDGIYVVCYGALLLCFWDLPQQGPRLIYGIFPVLVGQMLHGAGQLLPHRSTHAATAFAVLMFALLAAPAAAQMAARMAYPAPPGLEPGLDHRSGRRVNKRSAVHRIPRRRWWTALRLSTL